MKKTYVICSVLLFILLVASALYAFLHLKSTPTEVVEIDTNVKTFTEPSKTFRFMYLDTYILSNTDTGYSTDWMNGSVEMGRVLARVTIPKSFQPNTNFSDARFTVGTSADLTALKNCLVGGTNQVDINGTPFTVFIMADAGAGNRYDTTSYRTVRNDQCYVVEYTIHSTNIGNYPPELGITEFDEVQIQSALEAMVHSFAFL